MYRWDNIENTAVYDLTLRMYRPLYSPTETQKVKAEGFDLDHYAYKYLGTELEMYKILDTNIVEYLEERGDVSRLKNILIPIKDESGFSE